MIRKIMSALGIVPVPDVPDIRLDPNWKPQRGADYPDATVPHSKRRRVRRRKNKAARKSRKKNR